MRLRLVDGTSTTCTCGEKIYFLIDRDAPDGFYHIQHGDRPEVVSPPINGPAGERSFEWRQKVHEYEARR